MTPKKNRTVTNPVRNRVSHLSLAIAVKELLAGPVTTHEIAEATGLHQQTVYDLFRALKSQSVVHISAWDVDSLGRDCIPVFSLGQGRDRKRRAKTKAQIAADYRARREAKLALAATAAPAQEAELCAA